MATAKKTTASKETKEAVKSTSKASASKKAEEKEVKKTSKTATKEKASASKKEEEVETKKASKTSSKTASAKTSSSKKAAAKADEATEEKASKTSKSAKSAGEKAEAEEPKKTKKASSKAKAEDDVKAEKKTSKSTKSADKEAKVADSEAKASSKKAKKEEDEGQAFSGGYNLDEELKKEKKKDGENEKSEEEAKAELTALIESKVKDLLALAKKKNNVLDYNEIIGAFEEVDIESDKMDKIFDYFISKKVDVRMENEEEPMDDDDMIDDEEEINMEKIDLSVPEGIGLEDPVRMYLKEIGKVPLLSAEDEVNYACQMENGIIAQEIIDEYYKDLPKNDTSTLVSDEMFESKVAKAMRDEKREEFIGNTRKDLNKKVFKGEEAKKKLAEANLRLVVSIAKRYVGRGMLFLDLIQEGNLGLIKAVEKFDYRKGFKFSTYATWWIRQAITRAIADQARTIRIPVHMVETVNKLVRVSRQLLQELGREPSPEEIAEEMEMPVERVREIQKISQEPVSLETPVGEEEDSHLGDFIQDDNVPVPAEAAASTLLKEQLSDVLGTLTDREQKVLRLRFGMDDGRARTLEEVGKEFAVTRERIRQIEAKALRKLRHPSRSKKLRDFLD